MRPRSRLTAATALAALLLGLVAPLASPPPAEAQFAVFDGANFSQNVLTAVRTAQAIVQRIQMIRHQIAQIEHMLTNLKHLEEPTLRQLLGLLAELRRLMERETRGLVYTREQLDELFGEIYPQGEASEDLRADELRRTETTQETARAALLASRRLGEDLTASQTLLGRMKEEALATEGNLQALQSLAVLESYTAEEVSRLTQQVLLLTNVVAVALAQETSSRSAAEETFRQAVEDSRRDVPPYAATPPLPVIPAGFARRGGR